MALDKYEVTELWVIQVKDAGWSPTPEDAWNTVMNGPWKTANAARSWATSDDGGFRVEDEGAGWRSARLTGPGWKDERVHRGGAALSSRGLRRGGSMKWFETHDEVVAFARHMVEDESWDARDLLAYLEKPWKWTPERDAWALHDSSEGAGTDT